METIQLGLTGRRTTRLGFGCSSVMGALTRRQSLAMLEAAFDAGIRHFDVAPAYGYGESESCLGEFAQRHHGEITVTTKFGIAAPDRGSIRGRAQSSLRNIARGLLGPVMRQAPGVKQALARTAAKVSPVVAQPLFAVTPARESLERSLRELRTDHVDLWLLHEVQAGDLQRPESDGLLTFCEDMVRSGKVGSFGVASGSGKVPALVAAHPAFCRVRQYEWSVLDAVPVEDGSFRLHHRALTDNYRGIEQVLAKQPAMAAEWSHHVGADLVEPGMLARLMLAASFFVNRESVVLFSSKSVSHIRSNVALAEDAAESEALRLTALRFYEIVQSNCARLGWRKTAGRPTP